MRCQFAVYTQREKIGASAYGLKGQVRSLMKPLVNRQHNAEQIQYRAKISNVRT